MKQLAQDMKSGVTSVVEVPSPQAGAGRVLVRVKASAVSAGTERMLVDFAQSSLLSKTAKRPDLARQALAKARRDGILAAWRSAQARLNAPLPLGYSCAGIVVQIGDGVDEFKVGDRVACAGAGWASHAEFVSVPRNLVAKLPDGDLAFEDAAFATLGAIALQGLRLAEPRMGETVAIIGLGLLGQLSAQLAKASGLRAWGTDLDPRRVELARRLGLDAGTTRADAEESARAFTQGRGFDHVLITADTPTSDPVELAGVLARDRGVVVAVGNVGLHVPRDAYYRKELTLKVSRSYGPGRYDPAYEEGGLDYPEAHVRWTAGRNLQEVVRLLAEKKILVAPLVTHRFPITDGARAYDLITGKTDEPFLGVLLSYAEDATPTPRVAFPVRPARGAPGIGVIGAGAYATSVFLPMIQKSGATLRAVCGASGLSAANAARRFGFAAACSSADDVLDDPAVDAVVVLTRHHLHAAQTLAALRRGKPVFVEKPLCLTSAELDQIVAAVEIATSPLIAVGFNRRFAPFSLALKEFLDETTGPKTLRIRVNAGALPSGHWLNDPAQGGGRLLGEGCHFIDWANFVVGRAPAAADAKSLDAGDWTLRLAYPDGSSAQIDYFGASPAGQGKERYEARAGERVAVLEDFRRLELSTARSRRVRRAWLAADKGHAALWRAFLDAARGTAPAPIPFTDIVASMRAAFAARESLELCRPVEIAR